MRCSPSGLSGEFATSDPLLFMRAVICAVTSIRTPFSNSPTFQQSLHVCHSREASGLFNSLVACTRATTPQNASKSVNG
jgi:hypothetical protein